MQFIVCGKCHDELQEANPILVNLWIHICRAYLKTGLPYRGIDFFVDVATYRIMPSSETLNDKLIQLEQMGYILTTEDDMGVLIKPLGLCVETVNPNGEEKEFAWFCPLDH
jgi:hypothetical protein